MAQSLGKSNKIKMAKRFPVPFFISLLALISINNKQIRFRFVRKIKYLSYRKCPKGLRETYVDISH